MASNAAAQSPLNTAVQVPPSVANQVSANVPVVSAVSVTVLPHLVPLNYWIGISLDVYANIGLGNAEGVTNTRLF